MRQPFRPARQAPTRGLSWRVWWVPVPSQLVRRGQDAFLQVVERMAAFFLAPGPGLAGFDLCGPGRGSPHQGVPRRGGSRRAAGEQPPKMIGAGHAQAGVVRAQAQPGPPSLGLLRLLQRLGQKRDRIVLMIEV